MRFFVAIMNIHVLRSAVFTRSMVLTALAALAAAPALADGVLLQGRAGSVTTAEVAADARTRISDAARSVVLAKPENVTQLAANVYVQRAMAAEAERKGLAQGPEAAAALVLARDKALADIYLADFEKHHIPDDAALTAYAQAAYRAASAKDLAAPERARARHILIKSATPDARAKAEQVLAELKAGAKFEDLARKNSEDEGSASKGGDVGYVTDGATVAPFEEALKALTAPGELSGVVETAFGFHIIRLEERLPEGKRTFDEVREPLLAQARTALMREARAKDAQRLLEGTQSDEAAVRAFSGQFVEKTAR